VAPEVEELTSGDPQETVVENARRKALAGMEMAGGEGGLVLGVDTEVVLDGRLLGKAGTEAEARDRLEALSGRTHEVLSGVVVMAGSNERSRVASSHVTFRVVPPELLDAYLDSGEWRDRAGAYAVQGLGSALVERIEGDLSNVIGLPVALLLDLVPDLLDAAGDSAS
jgi:septum formation protein